MGAPLSVRDTSPVGVPAPGAVAETSTVYVSCCPGTGLEGDGAIATLEGSKSTTWVSTGEVLASKTTLPL